MQVQTIITSPARGHQGRPISGARQNGKARLEGNADVLKQLACAVKMYDPLLEIMPGTRQAAAAAKTKEEVFEHDTPRAHEP